MTLKSEVIPKSAQFPLLLLALGAASVFFLGLPTSASAEKKAPTQNVSCSSPNSCQPKSPTLPQRYVEARDLLSTAPAKALIAAKSLPHFPLVDDLRLRLLADAYLKNAQFTPALEALEKLKPLTPEASERAEIDLERAEILFQQHRFDDARKIIDSLSVNSFKGARGADRRYLQARYHRMNHDLLLQEGKKDTAIGVAKSLFVYLPGESATQRPGLSISTHDLNDAERFRRAIALYNVWEYDEARNEFLYLLKKGFKPEESKWYVAMIDLRKLRDHPKRAESFFKELSRSKKVNKNRAAEATYYYGRALMRQERYKEAQKVFNDYLKRFPKGSKVQEIQYYEGWLPYDHRKNKDAIQAFKKYIKKYGRRSRQSSFVYGFLAWAYMREGEWQNAIETWNQMIPFGNPLVAGKAMYWKAYALHQLHKNDDAIASLDQLRKKYPLTYYQMLGEQLRSKITTGKTAKMSQLWWPKRKNIADDSPRINLEKLPMKGLSKSTREKWERVLQLAKFDEKHLARTQLSPIQKTILAQAPKNQKREWIQSLGALVDDYNLPWKNATGGNLNALTTQLPDSNSLQWSMAYPRSYPDTVQEVAQEFNLSPYFIWSIMRQESRYKPGAISHTNAVGALQMIPTTATKIADELGLKYDVRTFFRPSVGFRYSGFYMRKLLDTFDGLYLPAAASYNSGPKPVARWFKRNPKAEFPWLIEEFEYNEGRAYCRKVTEHMIRYLYLYAPDDERKKMLDLMFPTSRDISLPDEVGY